MSKARALGAVLVSTGALVLLAGAENLATNLAEVDHTVGYALAIAGALMLGAGFFTLLLSPSASNPPSANVIEAGRDATQNVAGRDIYINAPAASAESLEDVKPNVVFDGFEYVRDQHVTPANISEAALSDFALLRFVNEPLSDDGKADEPKLHARVEIGDPPFLVLTDGRWAENVDREEAPGVETKSVPIPGNGETRTLNVAMQRRDQDEAYGWSHGGRKIPDPPIPVGTHPVRVELDGTVMEKREFRFQLINKGKEDYLELLEAPGSDNTASRRWLGERSPQDMAAVSQIPVSLQAVTGKRDLGSSGEFLMWADLLIKNESDDPLVDVGVTVDELRNAFPVNDEWWWSPSVKWNATNLVWSTRHAAENSLLLTIPAHETRTVTVAFCNDSNGNGGWFCVPNFSRGNGVQLHSAVNQLDISVSSSAGGLPQREVFYLQCHPNYLNGAQAEFAFKPWSEFVAQEAIGEIR